MQKTTEIIFYCNLAQVEGMSSNKVRVTVQDPDTDHILEDIHEEDLGKWIRENKSPDDVFSEKQLEKWAEENGYTKE